jgi:hypothetical protein
MYTIVIVFTTVGTQIAACIAGGLHYFGVSLTEVVYLGRRNAPVVDGRYCSDKLNVVLAAAVWFALAF